MTTTSRRQAAVDALEFRRPAYVPWAWGPTLGCLERLMQHLDTQDREVIERFLAPHILTAGATIQDSVEEVAPGRFRDAYGVTWDRTVDADIGSPVDWPIKRPEDLDSYQFPDADRPELYAHIPGVLAARPDRLARFKIGFSLYERAWSLRGMDNLLMDMIERPEFVDRLLDAIADHNLVQLRRGLAFGFDAVYFGDDYGMQTGLIMGARLWRRFIKPRLARMFAVPRGAGKFVMLHSCGRVEELFDDLVEIGLNSFNPFQPEVMDVFALKKKYHGRLSFHGGLSIQKTLPFGTPAEVRAATQALIAAGRDGGYIFSPSHAVPKDVPPENLVAMMEVLRAQPGAPQME